MVIDGELYEVEVELKEGTGDVEALLQAFRTGVVRRVSAEVAPRGAIEGGITAPITGRVVEIRVKAGDHIERGTLVAVLEAMKTRVEVKASKSGTVKHVLVKEGDTIKQGEPLIVMA